MAAGRNVSVDPQAPAAPVIRPEITEIVDLIDGSILDVRKFISSHRYGDFVAQRVRIRESMKSETPLFACAVCGATVYAVASPEKQFFFRHSVEDGSCPARTRDGLSQSEILARKYHGLRESKAHRRIKLLIERSLTADPSFAAQSIQQETRWRSSGDPTSWRQPDVQAVRGEQRFAFEVQLSTTFLGVVVERRIFYRDEGAALIWVLGNFDPDCRRLTVDDLLFSNNSNILVVDEETTATSEAARSFHVRCFFRRPATDDHIVRSTWQEKVIRFAELTIDVPGQRAYYFDHDGEVAKYDEEALRREMFDCWDATGPRFVQDPDVLARWLEIRRRAGDRGIVLPETPHHDSSFRAMMNGLLSARRGFPVGWQFNTLVEVAHRIAQGYPEHLLAFGHALKMSRNDALIASQDLTGKWKRKSEQIRHRLQAGDPSLTPDSRWQAALGFLFPEISARLNRFRSLE